MKEVEILKTEVQLLKTQPQRLDITLLTTEQLRNFHRSEQAPIQPPPRLAASSSPMQSTCYIIYLYLLL